MKHIITILVLICCFSAKAQVTVTYTYDDLHRLTQASYSNGVGIQYAYDALGNRTQETKTSTLSVEDFGAAKTFKIYPNPFQEELHISSDEQNMTAVQVYDVLGKLIQSEKIENLNLFTLKTPNLSTGVYFIHITSSKGKEIHKVIKK